eukprot:1147765-Pelagomonas_calceolata.AAC.6
MHNGSTALRSQTEGACTGPYHHEECESRACDPYGLQVCKFICDEEQPPGADLCILLSEPCKDKEAVRRPRFQACEYLQMF